MAKYKITSKAVDDLSRIWHYTFYKWSEIQADKYYLMLVDNFNEIANNPRLGKKYFGVTENLMGLRAGRHIIFYRKTEEQVIEITRILHERMDIKGKISEK